jgi:hypothetical protein
LVKALGGVGAQVVPTTEAILSRVGKSGLIGYNALGSYACIESKKDEAIGVVYPRDYTLLVTRVMIIGKKAVNPNAARLWVDYLLSERGQSVMANRAGLIPVRSGSGGTNCLPGMSNSLGQRAHSACPSFAVCRRLEAIQAIRRSAAGHCRKTLEARGILKHPSREGIDFRDPGVLWPREGNDASNDQAPVRAMSARSSPSARCWAAAVILGDVAAGAGRIVGIDRDRPRSSRRFRLWSSRRGAPAASFGKRAHRERWRARARGARTGPHPARSARHGRAPRRGADRAPR